MRTPVGPERLRWCAAPGGLAERCGTESLWSKGQVPRAREQLSRSGEAGACRGVAVRRSERLSEAGLPSGCTRIYHEAVSPRVQDLVSHFWVFTLSFITLSCFLRETPKSCQLQGP